MPVTRGQLYDRIASMALADSAFRQALAADPRSVLSKQLGTKIPLTIKFKVVEETADTYYVVLPYVADEGGELSDADLEKVAGGGKAIIFCAFQAASIVNQFNA